MEAKDMTPTEVLTPTEILLTRLVLALVDRLEIATPEDDMRYVEGTPEYEAYHELQWRLDVYDEDNGH